MIKTCVMCGSNEIITADLDVPIKSSSIKSVKVTGTKCNNCGEEYINSNELKAIEEVEKALNELAVGA